MSGRFVNEVKINSKNEGDLSPNPRTGQNGLWERRSVTIFGDKCQFWVFVSEYVNLGECSRPRKCVTKLSKIVLNVRLLAHV